MQKIKILILLHFLTGALFQNIQASTQQAATDTSKKSSKSAIQKKASQMRQEAATAAASAKKPASASSSGTKPTPAASGSNDAQLESLVEDFVKTVEKITCSCGSKKDKDGKIVKDDAPRCKHDSDHLKLVKEAYESYEKLYESMKEHGHVIDHKLNQKVLPSVEKIFQCKNIKNKAWLPKVTGQATASKSASK
jgi:hypothetical protein